MSLRHEVLILIVAGAALGVGYNAMGLKNRPSRGIPWLAVKTSLASLEELVPPDSAMAAPPGASMAPDGGSPGVTPSPVTVTPSVPTPDRQSASGAAGSAASSSPGSGTASGPAGAPAAPAGTSAPTPATPAASLPDPRRAAPLPFIPDSDQPIQVQVTTVKRYFDARAALFLDARDPAEYAKGHIPGAIRLTNPEAQNEPERVKALPVEGRPTIVYCEGGTCEASIELARFLIESGFKKVLVYMGGFPEWQAAGHPVELGAGR